MVPEKIQTERLVLHRFRKRDADAITEGVRASLPELMKWLPWAYPGYRKDDAAAFIKDSQASWKEGRAFDFGICMIGEPDRHIGNISIWQASKLGRIGEIGYWVRTESTSQGVATEATASLIRIGFESLRFHKLNLRIAVGNRNSERVAEKLGFFREGVLREELMVQGRWVDHALFSLLESEWAPQPRREWKPEPRQSLISE